MLEIATIRPDPLVAAAWSRGRGYQVFSCLFSPHSQFIAGRIDEVKPSAAGKREDLSDDRAAGTFDGV